MINIVEFLAKKHQDKTKLEMALQQIFNKYNPEYIIICYYQPHFDAEEIEKGYVVCMGTEEECCKFANVDKWKVSYIEGVNAKCDDNAVNYIKDNFDEEVDLNDSGWFIEFHKVEELSKTISTSKDSFNDKFLFIA